MNRGFRKFVAVLSAIAIVISSMTVYNRVEVKADVDWTQTDSWRTVTVGSTNYKVTHDGTWLGQGANLFEPCNTDGNFAANGIHVFFSTAVYTKIIINGTEYMSENYNKGANSTDIRFDGAQVWIAESFFSQQQTTVQFYHNTTLQDTMYVYNPNGSGGSETSSSAEESSSEASGVDYSKLSYNDMKQGETMTYAIGSETTPVSIKYAVSPTESQGDIVSHMTDGLGYIKVYDRYSRLEVTWHAAYSNAVLNINGKDIKNGDTGVVNVADTLALIETAKYLKNNDYNKVKITSADGSQYVTIILKVGEPPKPEQPSKPAAPEGLAVSNNEDSTGMIVNFTDVDTAVSYNLYINDTLQSTITNGGTFSYASSNVTLEWGKSYLIHVTAVNKAGESDKSAVYAYTMPVKAVTDVTAAGKIKSIEVSWTPQSNMPSDTQYYIYLNDDLTNAKAVITGRTSATLTEVTPGNYIVTVKACVDGNYSEIARSSYVTVYNEATAVIGLTVDPSIANTLKVEWDSVAGVTYKAELLDSDSNVRDMITECTVSGEKVSCTFTNVAAGTYTVRVTTLAGDLASASQVSNSAVVTDPEAKEVNSLTFNTTTYNTVIATWTVVNNAPTEGQTYNVYLDGALVADGVTEMTYTFSGVSAGKHTVKVRAVLNTNETTGKEALVIATAAPITKFETVINQVTNYGDTPIEIANTVWSYQFPIESTDCYLGVDTSNNIIVYSTKNRNQSNFVYQSMTGLEIGKYYTYSYTVTGDVDGLDAIPVHVSSEVSQVDYTVTPGTATTPTTITRTFLADVTDITIRYDLGKIADGSAVKISPVAYNLVQPVEATSITAAGRVEAIDVEWTAGSSATTYQTYNVYITDTTTSTASTVAENVNATSYKITGLGAGTYTVTVKATINGIETTGVTSSEVTVGGTATAITSSDIAVEGFQIRTNDVVNQTSVAFRTVCKAPNIGTTITGSDGNTYKVASVGTIYAIDPNWTGYKKNNKLNSLYTLLDATTVIDDQEYRYVGANLYDGNQHTYGYVATEKGYMSSWKPEDNTHTYYVITMEDMDAKMAYAMHVRAFVVATDGTIIYGESTAVSSVAQIADYLYTNSMSKNYSAHKYLYENILHSTHLAANATYGRDVNNLYYRDMRIDYGWNGILYVPGTTATLATDTLASLQ